MLILTNIICQLFSYVNLKLKDALHPFDTICPLLFYTILIFANAYSFTPPAAMLLTMYLEQKANTIKIGITEIATAKYIAP